MTQNQQNISSRNAYARFMMGSIMTAYGTIQLIRNPKSRKGQMLVLYGAMKAAEGATRYCPRKAMTSEMTSGNLLQKMMNGNASNSMNQTSGTFMQMVGNIAKGVNKGNTTQSMTGNQSDNGTQNMSGMGGQNNASINSSQTSGTVAQAIGNIAQNIAPQASNIINDLTSMTGSQNATGTNKDGKQASTASSTSNTNTNQASNGNTNGQDTNAKSDSQNNGNNQASSIISAASTNKNSSSPNYLQ